MNSSSQVSGGSFGFSFPEFMTFTGVSANADAGIELMPEDGAFKSPIFEKAAGYYANTWAVSSADYNGYIDATNEEILIATFTFTMTEEQRESYNESYNADSNFKLPVYVKANRPATANKYYDGENYLVYTVNNTDELDVPKSPVEYVSHTEMREVVNAEYKTYGMYNSYKDEYTIEIKVKGGKINLGAFGLAFNTEYMTFDPNANDAVVLADGINMFAELNKTADGYAFVYNASPENGGYIDAIENEVLIATIKLSMNEEQRTAFVDAGAKMEIFTSVEVGDYFDGENYIVAIYEDSLNDYNVPAEYVEHIDDEEEISVADVKLLVNLVDEKGATLITNLAQMKIDNGEFVAIEAAGNNGSIEHTIAACVIGQTYTITIEKNGYVPVTFEFTVDNPYDENVVEVTLIPGDIKGNANDFCGDGVINISDFTRVTRGFAPNVSDEYVANMDIDEDAEITVTDLSYIKNNYKSESKDTEITFNGEKITATNPYEAE